MLGSLDHLEISEDWPHHETQRDAAVSKASLYAVTLQLKMMLSASLSSIVSPGIVTQDTGGVKIWPVV